MSTTTNKSLTVVVPTLNEAGNIAPLVERIDKTLSEANISYEILFVDDHSIDETLAEIKALEASYPIRLSMKKGKRGKAFSLLQGFSEAKANIICMIDADLQYPPEAIAPMFKLQQSGEADIVVTRRQEAKTSLLRQLSSYVFNLVFTRLLFGINYDTQSGLKLFDKRVLDTIQLAPTQWSFDLEFIVRALENNYHIVSYTIDFAERTAGEAKINVAKVAFELSKASISLWRQTSRQQLQASYSKNLRLERRLSMLLVLLMVIGIMLIPTTTSALGKQNKLSQELNSIAQKATQSLGSNKSTTPKTTTPAAVTSTPVATNASDLNNVVQTVTNTLLPTTTGSGSTTPGSGSSTTASSTVTTSTSGPSPATNQAVAATPAAKVVSTTAASAPNAAPSIVLPTSTGPLKSKTPSGLAHTYPTIAAAQADKLFYAHQAKQISIAAAALLVLTIISMLIGRSKSLHKQTTRTAQIRNNASHASA